MSTERKQLNGTHILNHKDHYGYTVLTEAVRANNRPVVEFLLRNGADPLEASSICDDTVLELAIMYRNTCIAEILLDHCPELLHAKSSRPPLLTAIMYNCKELVRLLLDRGADQPTLSEAEELAKFCDRHESLEIIINHKERVKNGE
nr:ankyrin repeat family A protein 2-like [Aedes albopictus]